MSLSDSWINGDFPEFIVYRYYWISVLSWFKSESQELMFSIPRLFMTGTKLRRLLQGAPNIFYNSFSKFSVKSTHNFDNVDEFCLKKEDCTNNWTQTYGTPCKLLTIHIPTLSSGVWTKLADTWTEAWRCGSPPDM